jgi:hypothetical protein
MEYREISINDAPEMERNETIITNSEFYLCAAEGEFQFCIDVIFEISLSVTQLVHKELSGERWTGKMSTARKDSKKQGIPSEDFR